MLGIESEPLEAVLTRQFKKKGDAVVAENIAIARAGYEYAATEFQSRFPWKAPRGAETARGHHRQPGHRAWAARRRA